MNKNKYNAYFLFRKNLVEESKSNNYEDAVMEWKLLDYDYVKFDKEYCICGVPIDHIFYIVNKEGHTLKVGNVCIDNFKLDNKQLYNDLNEIKKKTKTATHQVRAKFALFTKVIRNRDYNMYMNLFNKRENKTENQKKYFNNIKNIIDKEWTKRYKRKKHYGKFINSLIIEEEEEQKFVDDD